MSTKTLGVVGQGYPNNPNCPNYPNYPNSLGMFQTKAHIIYYLEWFTFFQRNKKVLAAPRPFFISEKE